MKTLKKQKNITKLRKTNNCLIVLPYFWALLDRKKSPSRGPLRGPLRGMAEASDIPRNNY